MDEIHVPLIQWQDIFAVVDDGKITIHEYKLMESFVRKQADKFSFGLGCIVVIPQGATAPPKEVQHHLAEMLNRLTPSIQCLGYVVEGTGFKGAIVRAALITMKVFIGKPYPVFVGQTVIDAASHVVPIMEKKTSRKMDIKTLVHFIEEERANYKDER